MGSVRHLCQIHLYVSEGGRCFGLMCLKLKRWGSNSWVPQENTHTHIQTLESSSILVETLNTLSGCLSSLSVSHKLEL